MDLDALNRMTDFAPHYVEHEALASQKSETGSISVAGVGTVEVSTVRGRARSVRGGISLDMQNMRLGIKTSFLLEGEDGSLREMEMFSSIFKRSRITEGSHLTTFFSRVKRGVVESVLKGLKDVECLEAVLCPGGLIRHVKDVRSAESLLPLAVENRVLKEKLLG